MLACLDVDYRGPLGPAVSACSLFRDWSDAEVQEDITARVDVVAAYEPGSFYRRELPCLLAVLAKVSATLDAIIIDGHVWLAPGVPGLGAHLHQALGGETPIVGVAKNAYGDGDGQAPLLRGASATPLYISSAGLPLARAVAAVAQMAGEFRFPAILKHVDRLCRDAPL